MNTKPRTLFALALSTATLLAGCNHAPPPAAPVAETKFAAIARGSVDVEGGMAHVAAPREGIVARVAVNVGDSVKSGDELLALDTTQATIARDAAQADVDAAAAQTRLLRAKHDALKVRADRAVQAAQAGAASDQSADDARQALGELDAEIAVAEAGVAAAKQKLRQADYEISVRTLHAPAAGKIVARNVRAGDTVAPGGAELIEILPDAPKIVRAELNESFVAKIAVGMTAEVRSEADPDKTFSARVTRLGDVFGPSKLAENAQEITDARDVECVLDLDGAPLRVGERVQVRILARTPH